MYCTNADDCCTGELFHLEMLEIHRIFLFITILTFFSGFLIVMLGNLNGLWCCYESLCIPIPTDETNCVAEGQLCNNSDKKCCSAGESCMLQVDQERHSLIMIFPYLLGISQQGFIVRVSIILLQWIIAILKVFVCNEN